MAAVMGSKNLKAVSVRGEHAVSDVADPETLREIARRIRGFGRGNVKVWGFDFMAHGPKTKRMPCYGCIGSCLRVSYTADNGKRGKFMCQSRFFYSPYAWLFYGDDNDVPFLANRACDEYGLDTWKMQELVDWLVRCTEAGVVTEEQSGLPLSQVGSLEFIERLVTMTALRQGFGEVLSLGAAGAAAALGEASVRSFGLTTPTSRASTISTRSSSPSSRSSRCRSCTRRAWCSPSGRAGGRASRGRTSPPTCFAPCPSVLGQRGGSRSHDAERQGPGGASHPGPAAREGVPHRVRLDVSRAGHPQR